MNNLPTVTDAVMYDLLGRPISTTRTVDGAAYAVSMTYDSIGRPLTLTYPDPDGAGPQAEVGVAEDRGA